MVPRGKLSSLKHAAEGLLLPSTPLTDVRRYDDAAPLRLRFCATGRLREPVIPCNPTQLSARTCRNNKRIKQMRADDGDGILVALINIVIPKLIFYLQKYKIIKFNSWKCMPQKIA